MAPDRPMPLLRFDRLKAALVGAPLPTSAHAEERLNNAEALAIVSSDALSWVAHATRNQMKADQMKADQMKYIAWACSR